MFAHGSPAAAGDEQHDHAAAPQQRRQSNAAPAPMQEPGESVSQVLIPVPITLYPSQAPQRSPAMPLAIAADKVYLAACMLTPRSEALPETLQQAQVCHRGGHCRPSAWQHLTGRFGGVQLELYHHRRLRDSAAHCGCACAFACAQQLAVAVYPLQAHGPVIAGHRVLAGCQLSSRR